MTRESVSRLLNAVDYTSGSLDDLTEAGAYYVYGNVTGYPEGSNGYVLVLTRSSGAGAKQLYWRVGTAGSNDGNMYYRQMTARTWGPWYKLAGTLVS